MNKQNLKTYAFIDSQNLNLGIQALGWKLDFKNFRRYLKDKYNIQDAYLFIGYMPGNESLYTYLQQSGFILVIKPTMELKSGKVKGNVDAELVLHTMLHINNFDKAYIVSNDGDFHCLIEHLDKIGKLGKILAPNAKYSRLFKKYNNYIVRLDLLRKQLERKDNKNAKISGRSKP